MKNKAYRVINILDNTNRGWLPVVGRERNPFFISYYTLIEEIVPGEGSYLIMEGQAKGQIVTIDYSRMNSLYFDSFLTDKTMVYGNRSIVISLDESKLYYQTDKVNTKWVYIDVNDLEIGLYKILMPEKPFINTKTKKYLSEDLGGSRFAETWFPIIANKHNGKYLHYGSYSEGCVTVLIGNTKDWNNIFVSLMQSRNGDNCLVNMIVTNHFNELTLAQG